MDALSADAILRHYFEAAGSLPPAFFDHRTVTLEPVDSDDRRYPVDFQEAWLMPDGRMAASVVVREGFGRHSDDPRGATVHLVFAMVGDRWLLDGEAFDEIERPMSGTCPEPCGRPYVRPDRTSGAPRSS